MWMGKREGDRVVFLIHDRFGASVPSPPTRGWEGGGGGGWDGDDDVWHVLLRTRRCSPGLFPGREGSNFSKRLTCYSREEDGPQKTKNDIPPFHIERFLLHCQRGVGGGEVRGVERRGGLPVCGGI